MERGHGGAVVVGDERAQNADRRINLARAIAQERSGDLNPHIPCAEQRAGAAQGRRSRSAPARRDLGGDLGEGGVSAPRVRG
jgi:hypothetical protein